MEPDKQVLITKRDQLYNNCMAHNTDAMYHFTLALIKLKEMKK